MEPLSGILHRRPTEGGAYSAAFVVGVVNRLLRDDLRLDEGDARAISYRHGVILIGVSHGAIAGRLRQQTSRIVDLANTALRKLGAPPTYHLQTIRTRTTS